MFIFNFNFLLTTTKRRSHLITNRLASTVAEREILFKHLPRAGICPDDTAVVAGNRVSSSIVNKAVQHIIHSSPRLCAEISLSNFLLRALQYVAQKHERLQFNLELSGRQAKIGCNICLPVTSIYYAKRLLYQVKCGNHLRWTYWNNAANGSQENKSMK